MKILGIYFGKNKTECENLNWRDKVQKIKQTLNLWKQRMITKHLCVTKQLVWKHVFTYFYQKFANYKEVLKYLS